MGFLCKRLEDWGGFLKFPQDFTSTLDALVDARTHVIVQWEILK